MWCVVAVFGCGIRLLFGCVALKVFTRGFLSSSKEGENLSFKKVKSLPHLAQNQGLTN